MAMYPPPKKKKKKKFHCYHLYDLGIVVNKLTFRARIQHVHSRSWELRTQKLKSHLLRTQNLKVLPLKPGVGQYIAIHATLTARDFFFAYFYLSGPFTCIFPKSLRIFTCVGCG